ncbi:MAG TPA: ABC transporter permease [Jiangellaceae bacterium]|nr:ABC transporter permease [Jiangellaceae bacterium]
MTTTELTPPTPSQPPAGPPVQRGGLSSAITDTLVMTWRNIRGGWRVPDNQIYMFIQPIMFVLLFGFVFSGAIPIPGFEGDDMASRRYMMPGIFAQTMAFAVASASVGLADDMHKGLIDRFRSLPMNRSAVISGRVLADLTNQLVVLAIMLLCGLLVGWRVESGLLGFLAGIALLVMFAFAMLWVGALIGLAAGSPQVASSAGLIWLFPVTFLSNAFIPTPTLPSWLQPIAEWNPFSTFVASTRELFGNPRPFGTDSLPSQYPIPMAIGWTVLIIAVIAPLAVRKYKRAAGG